MITVYWLFYRYEFVLDPMMGWIVKVSKIKNGKYQEEEFFSCDKDPFKRDSSSVVEY